ncbi:probable E3 ubiquitin-protein ligase DTX2 isoform X1 [Oncorhynchus nerka]|uniref:probable E3 ubiquitin-protein ligase DTX2 isoform X1 n=1 Tax=Oncorhynchus nerka TaxID=8023 RepID=UPI00113273BA|nr:probable E3 ubiquitin-protein ligase DTX2 isoform X3 [Oncorhynchus nerka]
MATASSSCVGRNVSRNGPSVSTPTSGAPGQSQPMVVVWEWQDDLGVWLPYSGQVSGYIEQCFSSPRGHRSGGPGSTSIWLGQSDPSLSPYLIDIPSLKQFRQDTGKTRSVRRQLFAQSSGLGSGVYWEWVNDEGGWTPYETRTSILLEHSYQARQATADIVSHGYNYIVDLTALAQVNKATGYRRPVRRQGNLPYPLASGASVIHSGPACSCQQCLSHSSTGPMSSRSRHSFSSGQLSRPSLQVPSRATGAHPTSVYSPYPRRPLSVGGMAWGGPWPLAPSASQLPGAQLALSTSANGLSIPAIPVQLNGSTSVSSALAGMASILMSAVGLGVRFMSAPSSAPPPPSSSSRPAGSKSRSSVRREKRQHRTVPAQKPEDVIHRYMEEVASAQDEDCIICMDRLSCPSDYDVASEGAQSIQPGAVGKFKCGHTLHMLCMLAMYNNGTKSPTGSGKATDGSLQCPSCKTIYGEKTGTQPKGKMEIYSISQSLPGHPNCGTIQIIYSITHGIQGPEHPNPGQSYTSRGFPRFCFLPDNKKGRKVLELLKVAWTRRLIFTVGTSSTTGEPDTVVWNEIHHKTEMMSNVSGHGYPDPNYLDNVLSELASQGVSDDCLLRQEDPSQGGASNSRL